VYTERRELLRSFHWGVKDNPTLSANLPLWTFIILGQQQNTSEVPDLQK
jgi:hypothetical protein